MGRTDSGRAADDLIDDLRAAVRSGRSVPASYAEAARAAFTWRSIEAELALLSYDSSISGPVVARGAAPPRVLVFGSADLTVHLEVRDRIVRGQLDPPRAGRVSLEEASRGVVSASAVEEDGFFVLACPGAGPVRLRLVGDLPTVTEWLIF
jgi:hypothetical protein